MVVKDKKVFKSHFFHAFGSTSFDDSWRCDIRFGSCDSSRLLRLDDGTRDKLFHNFVGAAVDGLNAGVDVRACDGRLHHVTPASVKLNALGSDFILEVGRPVLSHGGHADEDKNWYLKEQYTLL